MYLIVGVRNAKRHMFVASTEMATEALALYHASLKTYPDALVIEDGETLDDAELKRHVDAETEAMEALKRASTLH